MPHPHHRKRNNDAPTRRDQPMHLFPEPEPPPKIDRRTLGGSKLKRGPRLSDEALRERGTLRRHPATIYRELERNS